MRAAFRVIDADGHAQETADGEWTPRKFLPKRLQDKAPVITKPIKGIERTILEGKLYPRPSGKGAGVAGMIKNGTFRTGPDRPKGMMDPHLRIPDMDKEGIDIAVVFGGMMSTGCNGLKDADLGLALCKAYNSWLAEYCNVYPERIKGVAATALQDPKGTAREVERAIGELGLVAVVVPPNVWGKNLDHRDFYRVYEACQDMGVPLCAHPKGPGNRGILTAGEYRFTNPFFTRLIGQPFEDMIASACIVCGGLLDKFPRLNWVILESGCGWLPYWMERTDHMWEKLASQVQAQSRPSDYFRQGRILITCEPEEEILPAVVDLLGEDCVMYASDYWHWDASYWGTVAQIADRPGLSDTAKRKILYDNAARFYHLS